MLHIACRYLNEHKKAIEDCVKDLDVILGSERTTLIIDDTPAVWPQHSAQVLVPKRYHFFPSSAARFKDSLSALATGEDEDVHRGQLSALLQKVLFSCTRTG